jgi:hypothetical protein
MINPEFRIAKMKVAGITTSTESIELSNAITEIEIPATKVAITSITTESGKIG